MELAFAPNSLGARSLCMFVMFEMPEEQNRSSIE